MSIKNLVKTWLIPPGISQILTKKPVAEKGFDPALFAVNKKFKDIHKGERCFILASGPSIKTQDLTPVYGEINIAVSHFHLHEQIKKVNPKYHVLAPQHPPFTFKDSSSYFRDFITQYADINPQIFLGITKYEYNYTELLKKHPEFKDAFEYYFLNYSAASPQLKESNQYDSNLWDITQSLFATRTVLYCALQVALYMGFKEIYLLGADHDYLKDTTRTTNHHFYAEEKGISDKSHLDAFSSEKWFEEYYMRWKQYRFMKEYAESVGSKIYNATEGGMLDVFERVDLSTLAKK